MRSFRILLAVLLLGAGCAQALSTSVLNGINSVPEGEYAAYLFGTDAGERVKVLLLKSPGSDVDIVAYSSQIVITRSTPREAMTLLGKGRSLSVEQVSLNGKPVGYLLISDRELLAAHSLRIDLFARSGKIYFSISKTGHY